MFHLDDQLVLILFVLVFVLLEFLALLYVPAFIAQQLLIDNARALVGVASYELFPFGRMALLSLLSNAPVSFLTGFLFTLACTVGLVAA